MNKFGEIAKISSGRIERTTGEISGTPAEGGRYEVVLGFASNTAIGEGELDLDVVGHGTAPAQ